MTQYEIERKYLIKIPDVKLLDTKYELTKSVITQTYLETNADEERVRKREYPGVIGVIELTHTIKTSITGLRRIEEEREISQKEYDELTLKADKNMMVIEKERTTFEYDNKTIEIDIYPFWTDKAILEVELTSETEQLELPKEIYVLQEVTDDKRYKNKSISKNKGVK